LKRGGGDANLERVVEWRGVRNETSSKRQTDNPGPRTVLGKLGKKTQTTFSNENPSWKGGRGRKRVSGGF